MKNVPTIVKSGQAVTPADYKFPSQSEVRDVSERMDKLVSYASKIRLTLMDLRNASWMPEASLERAQNEIDGLAIIGMEKSLTSGRLQQMLEAIEPAHWYLEDEEGLNPRSVGLVLARFMGSYPTSNIPNPALFTQVLLEDLMEMKPSYPEVEAAFRKLRTGNKFMPAISEVVAAVKAEQSAWERRWNALHSAEDMRDEAQALLSAEVERRAAEKVKRAEEAGARAEPLCVGARVIHQIPGSKPVKTVYGAGTITELLPNHGAAPRCVVAFDSGPAREVAHSFLVRLIPGDVYFSPPSEGPWV